MDNYDPNMTNSGRMAKQHVRVTFQQWEFTATLSTTVFGNCTGLMVMESAVSSIYEDLAEEEDVPYITMDSPEGDMLTVADDGGIEQDFLREMVVKAEILSIEPDE